MFFKKVIGGRNTYFLDISIANVFSDKRVADLTSLYKFPNLSKKEFSGTCGGFYLYLKTWDSLILKKYLIKSNLLLIHLRLVVVVVWTLNDAQVV